MGDYFFLFGENGFIPHDLIFFRKGSRKVHKEKDLQSSQRKRNP